MYISFIIAKMKTDSFQETRRNTPIQPVKPRCKGDKIIPFIESFESCLKTVC